MSSTFKGDSRSSRMGEKEQGGNIFDGRTPIAIIILVKNRAKPCGKINYHNIGDSLTKKEKLERVKKFGSIGQIKTWQHIIPSKQHGWINLRNPEFEKFIPIESKQEEARGFYHLLHQVL